MEAASGVVVLPTAVEAGHLEAVVEVKEHYEHKNSGAELAGMSAEAHMMADCKLEEHSLGDNFEQIMEQGAGAVDDEPAAAEAAAVMACAAVAAAHVATGAKGSCWKELAVDRYMV